MGILEAATRSSDTRNAIDDDDETIFERIATQPSKAHEGGGDGLHLPYKRYQILWL
jgi:hypothetical protein